MIFTMGWLTWFAFSLFNCFVLMPVLLKLWDDDMDDTYLFQFISFVGGPLSTGTILGIILLNLFGKLFKNVRVKFPEIPSICGLINKIWRLK